MDFLTGFSLKPGTRLDFGTVPTRKYLENVKAYIVSPTAVEVSWDAFAFTSGQDYKAVYGNETVMETVTTSETSIILGDLSPGSTVTISLTALDLVETSPNIVNVDMPAAGTISAS